MMMRIIILKFWDTVIVPIYAIYTENNTSNDVVAEGSFKCYKLTDFDVIHF